MVSKNRIGNHAMNLLAAVATYREDDDTVSLFETMQLESETDHDRMAVPLSLCVIA
jgi:hypothetical protein